MYTFKNDLVYENNKMIEKLRYVENKIIKIDPNVLQTFYIDKQGIKHVVQIPDTQYLECKLNDILINIDGVWKIKTFDESYFDKLYQETEDYILLHYPQTKQLSDINDKIYYEAYFEYIGVENLAQDIVQRVSLIRTENKSVSEVLSDIDADKVEGYTQLIKTALRQNWINNCKIALEEALNNKNTLNLPEWVDY